MDKIKFIEETLARHVQTPIHVPSGAILQWATSTAPSGWFLCDGSAVSRTDFADLYGIIGTTYGVGDGSTTFNLPNSKGRVIVGFDTAQTDFNMLGKALGETTHQLIESELASHQHASTGSHQHPSSGSHAHSSAGIHGHSVKMQGNFATGSKQGVKAGSSSTWGAGDPVQNSGNHSHPATGTHSHNSAGDHQHSSIGSNTPHNNLQPYLVLNLIIKT